MTAQATLDAQPLGSVQLAAGRSAVIDKALDAKAAGAAQSLRISGDGDGRAYVTTTLRYSTPPPTTPIEAGLTVTRRYFVRRDNQRSEEHTSELQSLIRISSAVFILKKKNNN